MRNKRLLRTLSAFCLTMVVAFGFTIPAFAQGSEQAPAARQRILPMIAM